MMSPESTGQEEKRLDNLKRRGPWWASLVSIIWENNSNDKARTIGEKNLKVGRVAKWISVVCMPPLFIVASAGLSYIMYSQAIWDAHGFLLRLPVVMLTGLYLAVVELAMGHLALFLPQTPFALWEALHNVGFKGIGTAVALTSGAVVFFDQEWLCITWSSLLGVLIACFLSFWLWLVRRYGCS